MTGDPGGEDGEGTKQFGINVTDSESAFLEWVAAYRNALAKARGKKLRRQWTRKTVAESFITKRVVDEREEFREILEAVGPFPDAKDEVAMLRYAQAVVAWADKKNK